jgi:hypothetical protein
MPPRSSDISIRAREVAQAAGISISGARRRVVQGWTGEALTGPKQRPGHGKLKGRTKVDVAKARELEAYGIPRTDIARRFGVSASYLGAMLGRKRA